MCVAVSIFVVVAVVVVVVVLLCVDDRACLCHARRKMHLIKKGMPVHTLFSQTDWLAPLSLLPPGTGSRKSRRRIPN